MNWGNNLSKEINWSREITNKEKKEIIAKKVSDRVKNHDIIGVGSGTTAYLALLEIAKKIKEQNLSVMVIPTSYEILLTCATLNIPTTTLIDYKPNWAFDGADEVDPQNNLIKGRGGAMFKEKLVLSSSPENYILADDSKMVLSLGEKNPVPVEVYPHAVNLVETKLMSLGATKIVLREGKGKDGPIITELGNMILDVKFEKVENDFEQRIKAIPGVIESGLFIDYNINILKA